jgi:hypothetical protein
MYVLLLGMPSGQPLLPGFPPLGISKQKPRSHQAYRMEGVRPGQLLHETPVFMRVLQNPVVRNNAALERLKSMEKRGISTVFLGFRTDFAYFPRKTAVFRGF